MKLSLDFFTREDPETISRELLGMTLYTRIGSETTSGIIVETEAYRGPEDRGSHAFNNRRTPRTEVMFQSAGHAYVYLCYGIHYLFNVVTGPVDQPHAVLLRAAQPREGIDVMQRRRGPLKSVYQLTAGPGALAQAFGIQLSHTGVALDGDTIWIEDEGVLRTDIVASPRVGMNFEGPWHSIPWRFRVKGNPWTSKAK